MFLACASPRGRALVDRRIYLPASRCQDPERCAAAEAPHNIAFAAKPRLALDMLADAVAAGAPAAFATDDEAYGKDPALRAGIWAWDSCWPWRTTTASPCSAGSAAGPAGPVPRLRAVRGRQVRFTAINGISVIR